MEPMGHLLPFPLTVIFGLWLMQLVMDTPNSNSDNRLSLQHSCRPVHPCRVRLSNHLPSTHPGLGSMHVCRMWRSPPSLAVRSQGG